MVAEASGALEEKCNDAALTCAHTSLAHTSGERQLRRLQRAHFIGTLARWPQEPNWRSALHWICACPSTGSISSPFYLSFCQRNVFTVRKRGDGGRRGENGQEKSRSEDDKGCRNRREGFETRIKGLQETSQVRAALGDLIMRLSRKSCISIKKELSPGKNKTQILVSGWIISALRKETWHSPEWNNIKSSFNSTKTIFSGDDFLSDAQRQLKNTLS